MAKVKIQGNAAGTGVFTIASPDSDTDRTITLPDSAGTLLDENSSLPAANLTGTVADARVSALTASKLTGNLPAISGASLTNLPAQTLAGLTDTTVSTSDPAIDTNPSAVGHLWVNKTSGECYVCTNITTDDNIWTNIGDGTDNIWNLDGSTSSKAATSIAVLLSSRGESNGSVTEGVYWFTDGTNTFPNIVKNISGNTWLLLQKNFVPHAYKGGDSNSGEELSYGLMDSGGSAIITTAVENNTTPTSSTLGINHARMSLKDWSNTFTYLGAYDKDAAFHDYTTSAANLHTKINAGQANNDTFEDDVWYDMGGGMYFGFYTKVTSTDADWMRMGLTDDNSMGGDTHNIAAEFNGVSWLRDGGSASYTTTDKDSELDGAHGEFSLWVR